jgi:hypothetical protein
MITGVFDMDSVSSPIGEYMLFMEILLFEVGKDGCAEIEIFIKSTKRKIDDNLYLFFQGFAGIFNCVEVSNSEELAIQVDGKKQILNLSEKESWSYINKEYGIRKYAPTLKCKSKHVEAAKSILNQFSNQGPSIAVHLKNVIRSSGKADWYNANVSEWLKFFRIAESRFKCHFFLIGNEALPPEMNELSNVTITKEVDSNLITDLAIIEISQAYIGSTSGPAQMAYFGSSPYFSYKNPDHHVELMKSVVGTKSSFVFANPYQNVYRCHEECIRIISDFEKVFLGLTGKRPFEGLP